MKHTSRACILTAGQGTRLGKYASLCNQALLPLGERAVISHILEKFPLEMEVVIALGDRGRLVREFLLAAHPERRFAFVEVDRFEGLGSGPGYSLAACHASLLEKPFYFVSSATLWQGSLPDLNRSWMAVAPLTAEVDTGRSCNVRLDPEGHVLEIRDGLETQGPDWRVFTGLGWVRDPGLFFEGLSYAMPWKGEKLVTGGFANLLKHGGIASLPLDWKDLSTEKRYEAACREVQNRNGPLAKSA